MDVYISEEYVNRRRMEKKAAFVAGKNIMLGSGSSKKPEKRNSSNPRMSVSRQENEFWVTGGGVYESFVFHCFSP
ncbi:hypothetical protein CARUB_v10010879mg [Capsella rubella]|uniref:Uncharacterized protein n=1 Tax=Capsella rubella TaxID=81985 RepID=R0IJX2_9BRAS|nr:uncharacterized protein LOC17897972 [Capsella rubella]EOA37278.1 hypothetical protein CARUB_v10010879mg [Capsella rubella]